MQSQTILQRTHTPGQQHTEAEELVFSCSDLTKADTHITWEKAIHGIDILSKSSKIFKVKCKDNTITANLQHFDFYNTVLVVRQEKWHTYGIRTKNGLYL